jgi:hypothetical protein
MAGSLFPGLLDAGIVSIFVFFSLQQNIASGELKRANIWCIRRKLSSDYAARNRFFEQPECAPHYELGTNA